MISQILLRPETYLTLAYIGYKPQKKYKMKTKRSELSTEAIEEDPWDLLSEDEKLMAEAEHSMLEAELEAWRESKEYKLTHKDNQNDNK